MSMVNRIPGNSIYGSISSAAGRSGGPSRENDDAKSPLIPAGSGSDSNNSFRSTSSSSTTSSARKMQRSSFKRTRMFQKNKRANSSTNSDSNETSLVQRSQISVVSQTPTASDASTMETPASRFAANRAVFQGNVGRIVSPSAVEEREAGADSPTFPPPKPAKHTSNVGSSSISSSPALHQKQLPKAKLFEKNESAIPQGHVENMLRFYGGDGKSSASLDLFRDVLKVSPDASDREIRIAYFRRGREILGDAGLNPDQSQDVSKGKANKLDNATKSRFQAVSMAYEILSNPSWKETYLKDGLKRKVKKVLAVKSPAPSIKDPFSSAPSTVATAFPHADGKFVGKLQHGAPGKFPILPKPNLDVAAKRRNQRKMQQQRAPTVLRKSSFTNIQNGALLKRRPRSPTRKRPASSVRWKDHVEELIFENHPNEHASDSEDSDFEEYEDDDIHDDDEERVRKSYFQNSPTVNGQRQTRNARDSNSNSYGYGHQRNPKSNSRIDEELESHLQRMDSEAEKHFVHDFWDNFEESMGGILSLVDSIGGGPANRSSVSKRPSAYRGRRPTQNHTIRRSSSYESSTSKNNTVVVDCDNEDFLKRSSSFPARRSSPSTLDAVSPSPLPSTFDQTQSAIVSPENKGYGRSQEGINIPRDMTQQKVSPIQVVRSPAMVSPSPQSKSMTDLDTTMSVASTIFSSSEQQQQYFRPISPCATEASEVNNSDYAPSSVASKKGWQESAAINVESDDFDINSRLSGLESVNLAELENPFRPNATSADAKAEALEPKPSQVNTDVSEGKKKNHFKASMTSTTKETSIKEETGSSRVSKKSDQSVEDVFAGVDEDSPLERYDMGDSDNLKVQDISIERSNSHVSDLSESVYSSMRENNDALVSGISDSKPSVKNSASELKTNARSQGSVAGSSNASTTRGDAVSVSVHSSESKGLEDSGFFEYFLAYASAVMTECANVGTSVGVAAEYQQNFFSIFSNDATEAREPPTNSGTTIGTASC